MLSYFQKRGTIEIKFASTLQQPKNGFNALHNISLLLTRSGNSHITLEELIIPAVVRFSQIS